MQCPNDQSTLVMSERKGIEVDYCPTCRGVWLDRGELDKIIDRSLDELGQAAGAQAPPPSAAPQYPPQPTPRPAPPLYGEPAPPRDPRLAYPPRRRFGSSASAGSPDDYGYRGGYGDPRYRKRRRKDSFLGELFDF